MALNLDEKNFPIVVSIEMMMQIVSLGVPSSKRAVGFSKHLLSCLLAVDYHPALHIFSMTNRKRDENQWLRIHANE